MKSLGLEERRGRAPSLNQHRQNNFEIWQQITLLCWFIQLRTQSKARLVADIKMNWHQSPLKKHVLLQLSCRLCVSNSSHTQRSKHRKQVLNDERKQNAKTDDKNNSLCLLFKSDDFLEWKSKGKSNSQNHIEKCHLLSKCYLVGVRKSLLE